MNRTAKNKQDKRRRVQRNKHVHVYMFMCPRSFTYPVLNPLAAEASLLKSWCLWLTHLRGGERDKVDGERECVGMRVCVVYVGE